MALTDTLSKDSTVRGPCLLKLLEGTQPREAQRLACKGLGKHSGNAA
jgi:hypothetical protein